MIRYTLILAATVLIVVTLTGCSQDKRVTKGDVADPKVQTSQAPPLPGTKIVPSKVGAGKTTTPPPPSGK